MLPMLFAEEWFKLMFRWATSVWTILKWVVFTMTPFLIGWILFPPQVPTWLFLAAIPIVAFMAVTFGITWTNFHRCSLYLTLVKDEYNHQYLLGVNNKRDHHDMPLVKALRATDNYGKLITELLPVSLPRIDGDHSITKGVPGKVRFLETCFAELPDLSLAGLEYLPFGKSSCIWIEVTVTIVNKSGDQSSFNRGCNPLWVRVQRCKNPELPFEAVAGTPPFKLEN